MQKGDTNRTGLSPFAVQRRLESGPTWKWTDPHNDVIRATPLVDDRLNLYLSTISGRVYKFSPEGEVLWMHLAPGAIPAVPAIMEGKLFYNRRDGHVTALDMGTGAVQWVTKISSHTGGDTACLFVAGGLIVSATYLDPPIRPLKHGENNGVVALRSDGTIAWTIKHEWESYNFQASSPNDGTMIFQDRAGGLYRYNLMDGTLIWESGLRERDWDGDFTTGAAVVGPNGLVYVTSNHIGVGGLVHAYSLSNGSLVWRQDIGLPVNQAVAVGRLAGSEGLSVVTGVGENPGLPSLSLALLLQFIISAGLSACCFLGCACRGLRKRQIAFCRSCCQWLMAYCALMALAIAWHYSSLHLAGTDIDIFNKAQEGVMVAMDADTGKGRWAFKPPLYRKPACEGDESFLMSRLWKLWILKEYGDPICLPDSWAQVVIGGDGTTYGGFMDGHVYAVADANGDGQISPSEVSRYFTGAGFQASLGMAPGMLAAAPCGGGLLVWRN